MHPSVHAAAQPDKPAVIMTGSGESWSYAELDRRSNRIAQLLRDRGLGIGDTVAFCLDNRLEVFAFVWGAQRAGLVYVAISNRLTAGEIAYIVEDSGARLLLAGPLAEDVLAGVAAALPDLDRFIVGGISESWRDWDSAAAAMPELPIADERAGVDMLYSSGTTGRPKGIRHPLPEDPAIAQLDRLTMLAAGAFGFSGEAVYLSPAPLYHAAPLRWCVSVHRLGGTVVVMERFDPAAALAAIECWRVTHSQWVPTHFVRMLKLPEAERLRHDVSSLVCAVHAAAPCPVPVKAAMIDWWGPVLREYYAGTEGMGLTFITSEEWVARPGSVGRAILGTLHICDEEGAELPPGETGIVYFGDGPAFQYHGDRAKTAEATHPLGWTTLGDVGHVDADGYLWLTDRKSFMIISGGVNIYPQEIENLLVTHPAVADAAVIGAPHEEMGEEVVAVVQPLDPAAAGPELAAEIGAWLRARLAGLKVPRRIDFRAALPRLPTGKLQKGLLRDEYRLLAESAGCGGSAADASAAAIDPARAGA